MKKIKKISIFLAILFVVLLLFHLPILNFYTQYRNERALTKIANVNEKTAPIFSNFIKEIEAKTDWKVILVSGYRTEAEQVILKKINAKNANPGKSEHNFAKAIDICLYKRKNVLFTKWIVKSTNKTVWENTGVLEIAKKYNLKWGGEFKNYYDPVHFEVID